MAAFDCRISQLPTPELVVDYFRWRQEDGHRNALSAHCYWTLRARGASAREATRQTDGKSIAEKNELLFRAGINFNDLPAWQKRGIGLLWEEHEKLGVDPRTGEQVAALRRRLVEQLELPLGDAYAELVASQIHGEP